MSKEKTTFKSLGHDLVGIIEYPEKLPAPGVILLHGLTNSKEDCPLINEIAEALVKEGIISFRFDFYGSGESPGQLRDRTWSISEQNVRDAIESFENKGVKTIGLWGRSTGGTTAILCGDDPQIKAFVLATTPVLLQDVFKIRFGKVKELELKLEQKGQKLPGTGKYKGKFEFSNRFFEEVPAMEQRVIKNLVQMSRVFILATTPDTKVPLNNSTTIINTVKEPKKIYIFEEVDHDYKGVENEAARLTVSWFKKYLIGGHWSEKS